MDEEYDEEYDEDYYLAEMKGERLDRIEEAKTNNQNWKEEIENLLKNLGQSIPKVQSFIKEKLNGDEDFIKTSDITGNLLEISKTDKDSIRTLFDIHPDQFETNEKDVNISLSSKEFLFGFGVIDRNSPENNNYMQQKGWKYDRFKEDFFQGIYCPPEEILSNKKYQLDSESAANLECLLRILQYELINICNNYTEGKYEGYDKYQLEGMLDNFINIYIRDGKGKELYDGKILNIPEIMESMGVRKKDKNLEVSSLAKKEAELQSLKEEERQLIEEERKQDKQIGE